MSNRERPRSHDTTGHPARPTDDKDRLLARYGAELAGTGLSEDQQKELLLVLWQVMRAFVELGFSVAPGTKFIPNSDFGMDDVIKYLNIEDTAHETVASGTDNNKEQL